MAHGVFFHIDLWHMLLFIWIYSTHIFIWIHGTIFSFGLWHMFFVIWIMPHVFIWIMAHVFISFHLDYAHVFSFGVWQMYRLRKKKALLGICK